MIPADPPVQDGEVANFDVTATSGVNPLLTSTFTDTAIVYSATRTWFGATTARLVPGGAEIRWGTVAELDNAGFHVWRSRARSGPWEEVGCCMIPGAGTIMAPRSYQALDPAPPASGPLFYRISDLDYSGARTWHPPVGIDRDGDLIPFDREEAAGLSDSDPADVWTDPDRDGVPSAIELAEGRDPFGPDPSLDAPAPVRVDSPMVPHGVRLVEATPSSLVFELALDGHGSLVRDLGGTRWTYPTLDRVVAGTTEVPGRPLLPTVGVLLPEGFRDLTVVSVESRVEGPLDAGPAPRVDGPAAVAYDPDPAFYGGQEAWPAGAAEVRPGSPGRPPALVFHPFSFDPVARGLVFRSRIRVRIGKVDEGVLRAALSIPADPGLAGIPAGPLVRVRTGDPGIYRILRSDLVAAGADPTGFDPRSFSLWRGGVQVPIRVLGESDGVFDPADSIELASDDPGDRFAGGDGFHLLLGSSPGSRWTSRNTAAPGAPARTSYRHVARVAKRDFYFSTVPGAPTDERWTSFPSAGTNASLAVANPDPAGAGGLLEVVYGASVDRVGTPDHHHRLRFDGVQVGEAFTDGAGFFSAFAYIPQASLTAGNHVARIEALTSGLPAGSVDFYGARDFSLQYDRLFEALGDSLAFTGDGTDAGVTIQGFSQAGVTLLDLDQPSAPVVLTGTAESGSGPFALAFGQDPGLATRFLAYGPGARKVPTQLRPVTRAGLRDPANRAGWLAVVPSGWTTDLDALVAARNAEGLEPMVVDLEDVADEFAGGVVHPLAIQRLVAHARSAWDRAPEYVLLVGHTHANPRMYPAFAMPPPPLMPTWFEMGGLGTKRIEVPADGFFGRLSGGDTIPEVAIGRIPARSRAELAPVVAKLAGYGSVGGAWARRMVAVAGDGLPFFEPYSDAALGYALPGMDVQRIYREQLGSQSAARAAVVSAFEDGNLLTQFTGHGAANLWDPEVLGSFCGPLDPDCNGLDDGLLPNSTVPGLANGLELPFVLSMTCQDGYFVDFTGFTRCLADQVLMAPNGGAVGYYAGAAITFAPTKDVLHRAVLDAIFAQDQRRVGDALRTAAAAYLANSPDDENLLGAFNLFGDPATWLAIPNPLAPQNLAAQRNGPQVEVTWDPVPDLNVVGYQVFKRVGSGTSTLVTTVPGTAWNDPVDPPLPGALSVAETRYYTVRAITGDGLGSSAPPEVALALSADPPPAGGGGFGGGGGGGGGCAGAPGAADPMGLLLVLAALAPAAWDRRRGGWTAR